MSQAFHYIEEAVREVDAVRKTNQPLEILRQNLKDALLGEEAPQGSRVDEAESPLQLFREATHEKVNDLRKRIDRIALAVTYAENPIEIATEYLRSGRERNKELRKVQRELFWYLGSGGEYDRSTVEKYRQPPIRGDDSVEGKYARMIEQIHFQQMMIRDALSCVVRGETEIGYINKELTAIYKLLEEFHDS